MKKLKDIECMRVVAMLLVVFAHVTRMYTAKGAISQGIQDPFITALTEWIYTFHMPAFVAISGIVYYYVKRERNGYNNALIFVYTKAKRLLIPYLFFAIFTVLPTLYYCNIIEGDFYKHIFYIVFLLSGPRHLWYVAMLFNLLVIFNFFENYIFKHKMAFLMLCFLIHIFSYFFFVNIFQIHNIFHYLIFFMVGYYFQCNRSFVNKVINNHKKKVLVFITSFMLSICIYLISVLKDIDSIIISLLCSFFGIVFLYFGSALLSEKENVPSNPIFKFIDRNNFGLYLFHPMIIYIYFYNIVGFNLNMWFSIILIFLLSTVVSLVLTCFMRKIHMDIFIGEKNTSKKLISKHSN